MKFAGILNETGPTLNENAFHSFVVAKQIFLWQLPQLHRCNWQLLVFCDDCCAADAQNRRSASAQI